MLTALVFLLGVAIGLVFGLVIETISDLLGLARSNE